MTALETTKAAPPTAKKARKSTTPRKAARPAPNGAAPNGSEPYVPPTDLRPEEHKPAAAAPRKTHPVYGSKQLYVYYPKDAAYKAPGADRPIGSEPLEFPHISTCQPTAVFFYDNRNKDEMHQAFGWMDLCEIPDEIGRRLFLLPLDEQATVLREWFGGLKLTPQQEVTPPGES